MDTRILLLSAYDARSHGQWRAALTAMFPDFQWTQLTLPPRNFAWRIRGNSLLWAFDSSDLFEQDFDLLIATSMVDLASLRGLVPALARIPSLVYFHENQFIYPANQPMTEAEAGFSQTNVEPKLVPLYSALCADQIVFNSHYNRDGFLQGCDNLFARLPDKIPAGVMARLRRSQVIPVPLLRSKEISSKAAKIPAEASVSGVLEVAWNHRWEYDKGPDGLLALVKLVLEHGMPVRFHVIGQKFRQTPAEFATLEQLLARHCRTLGISSGRFGFIKSRQEYSRLLESCDVVLSTAKHDFQGLAIQEAIAAGCTPLAPRRLVYPEYLDQQFLYFSANGNSQWHMALEKLAVWAQHKANGQALPKASVDRFYSETLRSEYADLFAGLLSKTC